LIHLAAGAFDLRQLAQFCFDSAQSLGGVTATGADQLGRHPFAVVQQGLQKVIWRDLLMVFPQTDGLGRLEKAFRPVGKFLDIHVHPSFATGSRRPTHGSTTTPLEDEIILGSGRPAFKVARAKMHGK